YLAEELNPVLQLRMLTCYPAHSQGKSFSIPTWSRTRTWTFGESNAIRYTIGTSKSRRLDLHQHGPVYGTGAFLNRATSACFVISTSARIRTPSGGFGDRLPSQENARV